jgi:hypothetical protein
MSTAPPITHWFSCVPDAYPVTSRNQRPGSDDRALVVLRFCCGQRVEQVTHHRCRGVRPPRHAGGSDDDPAGRSRTLLPHALDDSIVLECIELADRLERPELGVRGRQGSPRQGEAGQALSAGLVRGFGDPIPSADDRQRSSPTPRCQRRADDEAVAGRAMAGRPLRRDPCPGRALPGGARAARVPYLPSPHVLASGVAGSIKPQCAEPAARGPSDAAGRGPGHPAVECDLGQKILGLPPWVTPYCVVPLGCRGRYGPTTRKPVEQVKHRDGYGNRDWLDS